MKHFTGVSKMPSTAACSVGEFGVPCVVCGGEAKDGGMDLIGVIIAAVLAALGKDGGVTPAPGEDC